MKILCAKWLLGIFLTLTIIFVEGSSKNHHGQVHHKSHHSHHNHLCFTEKEIEASIQDIVKQVVGKMVHLDRYPAVYLVPHLEDILNRRRRKRRGEPDNSCPNLQSSQENGPIHDRSISPWSYRIDIDESRYPQKLAFAQCLCSGCIDPNSGTETASLNSVPIDQTMMVLRKKRCPNQLSSYMFETEYIKVPVGCTCVIPRQ